MFNVFGIHRSNDLLFWLKNNIRIKKLHHSLFVHILSLCLCFLICTK